MWLFWLLLQVVWADCDARRSMHEEALAPTRPAHVLLVVDIQSTTNPEELAQAIAPLETRNLPVLLMVPADWTFRAASTLYPTANVGVAFASSPFPSNDAEAVSLAALRDAYQRARRAVTKQMGHRPIAVGLPAPSAADEVVLDDLGFRALLQPQGPTETSAVPTYGGTPGRMLRLPGSDPRPCGTSAGNGETSLLNDLADAGPKQAWIRVHLSSDPAAIHTFVSWWDAFAVPAGWSAVSLPWVLRIEQRQQRPWAIWTTWPTVPR